MSTPGKDPPEVSGFSALGAMQGALMPIGCMFGLVVALFWLVMILLLIVSAWIWSLPSPK